jgi:hypothetical protein
MVGRLAGVLLELELRGSSALLCCASVVTPCGCGFEDAPTPLDVPSLPEGSKA